MKLLDRLIEQAKNPNGFVGSVMLNIMNSAHMGMNKWAMMKMSMHDVPTILDVGCGGGKAIQLLSELTSNGTIYGIDYSEQAVIDSIRANKQDVAAGKVHIQKASVTDLPFQEETMDIVTAFQTHYFWPDLPQSIQEVYRVLKPGGSFYIVAEIYKIHYHMTSYKSKEDLESLFQSIGFRTFEYEFHPNEKWICVKGEK